MDAESLLCIAVEVGNLSHLKKILEHREKDAVVKLVSTTSHGTTPLVIACRNGRYDVAEYLIEKCGANVNQPGIVMFDGELIECAHPLWCAAAAGHLALVQLLVKHGARVNSTTKTGSTPLRAACFDGHFDIVRFLVIRGANIEIANRHGHTCLMIACYKGHVKIAKFLLSLDANPNRRSKKGNTALHDCAESGSLEIVKLLIEHGARMNVDSYDMSPLLAAAETGHKHIVEYFINMPNLVSRKERIDALELLGATYVDKKRDMMGALKCWREAMDERYRVYPVIPKPPSSRVVPAYNFAQEITDPDALDGLLNNPDEMRMQALVIRERILGQAHPDTSYYIRHRGAVYADSGVFSRCIELWNYGLAIQQSILEPLDPMTESSFYSFVELFTFMIGRQISTGCEIPAVQRKGFLTVLKRAVLEAKLGKQMLDKTSSRSFNKVLLTALHLANLLTHEMPEEGTPDYTTLHRALYILVRINATDDKGRNVLQLAFSQKDTLGRKSFKYKMPSPQLIKALIRVGADVTARDDNGNTVLHLAAVFHPSSNLITILLDAGAHIDVVNKFGETFEELIQRRPYVNSSTQTFTVYPVRYITLACLAARVVKKTYDIELVPKHLRDFVLLH